MKRSLGFTLLEMIVSIVLLAVVGLSLNAIIQHSMSLYADTTIREELLLQGRFVTERMHKEIRDAVPNSVQINQTTQCIEWLPITNTAVYEALPLAPGSANTMRVLPEHGFVQSERVVIMPINAQDLLDDIPSNGVDRVAEIKEAKLQQTEKSENMVALTFTQETSFTANSPAHRLFAYKSPVAYCLEGHQLYRYANYPLSRSELSPAELSTGDREIMAENIKSVQFDIEQASLVRNGLVKLQFVFSDNNEEVRLDHDVLIANTP
ncbi:prepilin-type N-terminal cleavage/methylation domain-containing protein [Aliivibrio finisterrensis]|uniref:PulJ/GspJ family protein n=1 Tax=Aliivibrio finisterrensis TaxID=511998 RepID=UPI001020866F|nr:prepilin-type N-terminal cleavage/methylation domain-containing protein [Aliivibrio finisterrensis]RYU70320.1 prepilin-type N-terminal cleavage/methylation domain-containing protein [Aliivibrio finisterrensis]RYU74182.1 prepilin-type N-terminal cleavage/methylation domain-containing protein [Aliivibrio finisterrensis]RYU76787.1 prepilin-type N-terminal cleavage/methylation domain-containing protein [Aliivibrio finisterrensis]